jgi:integrase
VKGSITRRCYCKDPQTGKEMGARCPDLKSSKHGEWEYRDRLPTSTGRRSYRRAGHRTRKDAESYRDHVYQLLDLAKGDAESLARIGDLVFRTKRGAQLSAVEDVRRRLGVGGELDRSLTVGQWLEQWLAGKRKLRDSTARGYRQHVDHYLSPLLGHLPLDRLSEGHISDMFDLIGEWNDEIALAREEGRAPVLDGDVRQRSGHVGIATQRRVYATLRTALNAAWRARRVDVNVALFVEMPAEYREPRLVWSPEQVGHFLDFTADHRLGSLYRLILLHGPRRGEAVGARRSAFDHANRELRVIRPILQLGGKLVESRPKTRAGERTLGLDQVTADLIRRECTARLRERLQWGEAYEDNDLIWCREDGSPYPPDYVSRHFIEAAAKAGLPRIQLHAARHTAATLALEAGVDIKVVSERMGHSNTSITQNLYQHVRRAVHDKAVEAVIQLLPERKRAADRTGS